MEQPTPIEARTSEHSEFRDVEPADVLVEHLEHIRRCVSFLCRRQGFGAEESQDLQSWIVEKLIEDEYSILRRFKGKSRWTTYLRTVVTNLVLDYRRKLDGRFRPSAAAKDLGVVAVRLERLIYRDGYSFEEAAASLASRHPGLDLDELSRTFAELPRRQPRRRRVGEETLENLAGREVADRSARDADRSQLIENTEQALSGALAGLSVEDRTVLRMRFADGVPVRTIASTLGIKLSTLYWRINKSLDGLRAALDADGIDGHEVLEALGAHGEEISVEYGKTSQHGDASAEENSPSPMKKRPAGSSNRGDRS